MSGGKTFLTFVAGIASGLALAYYADPKGSKQKIKKLEKEIQKNRKLLEGKMETYKGTYNKLVDKYADTGKGLIDKSKEVVDTVKQTVKASSAKSNN